MQAASAERETICAIATPGGPARRAAIRVSGSAARALLEATFCGATAVTGRGVFEGRFDDGSGTQPCVALWMPGPRSYTREDVVEFHLPGAPPLAQAALSRLLALGARVAEPGEFTRRAFENGRIDLTRAEGVLELVSAGQDSERRAALALLEGGLELRLAGVRERLENLRALAEASLDFDEADTGHVASQELLALAGDASAALEEALSWETRRLPSAAIPRVVLVGAPNAGKSSLFNALLGRDGAIVSDHAGTTRDALVGDLQLVGRVIQLEDLPGLEASRDELEASAQVRAQARSASADLALWVVDARTPASSKGELRSQPTGSLLSKTIGVWNQVDRPNVAMTPASGLGPELDWIPTSAVTGQGLSQLREAIAAALSGDSASGRELSARHRVALVRSREALDDAVRMLVSGGPLDLSAQALRLATDELDEITGRTTPEDLLDRIFARFCLGK